jgi:hypothetical protein
MNAVAGGGTFLTFPEGRTWSADAAALQTAGVVAYGRTTGPRAPTCRSKSKAKNPKGFGGQESPDSFDNTIKKQNYVSVFSGELYIGNVVIFFISLP